MKMFFKRVFAFVIDILLVGLFATALSNISVINVQLDDYNKVYEAYLKDTEEYQDFNKYFKKYYKDKKIDEKELNKLSKKTENYYKLVEEKYDDKKITKKEYNKILDNATDQLQDLYKDYNYKMNKYSVVSNIIYTVVILLYFVIFQYFVGQTLGKKIMSLKTLDTKEHKPASIAQLFIRAIILYNVVFFLIDILVAYVATKDNCYSILHVSSLAKSLVQWIILFMIAMSLDGRGLHDVCASTIVVDTKVKEAEIPDAKIEEKEENKEEVKKTSPKKKSTTKKTNVETKKKSK